METGNVWKYANLVSCDWNKLERQQNYKAFKQARFTGSLNKLTMCLCLANSTLGLELLYYWFLELDLPYKIQLK